MGYTTDFEGRFNLDKPLTKAHAAYLKLFTETRRMRRNVKKLTKLLESGELSDSVRVATGLPLGNEGEFFTGGVGDWGQGNDDSVMDHNYPPSTQPGLWCDWAPTEDRTGIEWNGTEKFYHYTEWLDYIVQNFLEPWGYVLNGSVRWQGEEDSDIGTLVVENNVVAAHPGRTEFNADLPLRLVDRDWTLEECHKVMADLDELEVTGEWEVPDWAVKVTRELRGRLTSTPIHVGYEKCAKTFQKALLAIKEIAE
jgi:hypothetical protein